MMDEQSPDERMNVMISPKRTEALHHYKIKWRSPSDERFSEPWQSWTTDYRHKALQFYILKRKELTDFATEPENYLVRFFCDGTEYLNDQESWPNGWRDRGKSCRQLSGAVRPYPWERKIP